VLLIDIKIHNYNCAEKEDVPDSEIGFKKKKK